jgi:hypothetical protein
MLGLQVVARKVEEAQEALAELAREKDARLGRTYPPA